MVQKFPRGKNKGNNNKPNKTTAFKKKKNKALEKFYAWLAWTLLQGVPRSGRPQVQESK
jgi:hypothetical protein